MKLDNLSLTMNDAQRDMRYGYCGGAPGMLASALAWLAAGYFALHGTAQQAVLALFVGGMLIHPVGIVFAKILRRPGAHTKGNLLGQLALEGTVWMIFGLALAYGIFLWRAELFFPAMLLVIGGRYLTFATLYGMRIYWACGATLALTGFLIAKSGATMATGAFSGAAIEIAFAVVIYAMVRKDIKP
jgi:hypothetical protein